jgi:hypothetical protein
MAKAKHLGVKKYMIVYDVPPQNGKARQQKREILCGVTKHEAESFLAKRMESVARAEYTADADMTMSDIFDKFMAQKAKRLEATTLDRYKGIIATYLRPTFGKMRLTALRKAHLIEAYEKWQAEKQTRRSGRRRGQPGCKSLRSRSCAGLRPFRLRAYRWRARANRRANLWSEIVE